jgi:hypothetical protein
MTLTTDFHAHQVLEGVFIIYDLGRDSEIMGGGAKKLRSNFGGPYKFQYSYGGRSQEFWCFSQEVI